MRSVIKKKQTDLSVIMENINDPHNISAILRTCDAVGIKEIYVLNTKPGFSRKLGEKSSASAKKWIDVHYYTNTAECFSVVRGKYKKIYGTYLGEKSSSLYELDLSEAVALVFGNEHDGISKEAIPLVDAHFIIPMVGMIPSLNVSVACAISLYEAFRQRTLKGKYNGPQLSETEIEKTFIEWKNK